MEIEGIPSELTKKKSMPGHAKDTQMSVGDLVAYLIGWGELVLMWHRQRDAGQEPDIPASGYKWTELGKLAQKFYRDYEGQSYKTRLSQLNATYTKVVRLVESKTNRQLCGSLWYRKCTMGQMIQLNTASPYRNAHGRIRRWKRVTRLH